MTELANYIVPFYGMIYLNMPELLNNCYRQKEPTSSSFNHIHWVSTGPMIQAIHFWLEIWVRSGAESSDGGYWQFSRLRLILFSFFWLSMLWIHMLQQNLAGNSTSLLAGISEERSPRALNKKWFFIMTNETTSTSIHTPQEIRVNIAAISRGVSQAGCCACLLVWEKCLNITLSQPRTMKSKCKRFFSY